MARLFDSHLESGDERDESDGYSHRVGGSAAIQRAGAAVVRRTGAAFEEGGASFYGRGDGFAGRRMANGLTMRPDLLIAAHKTLPYGTVVRVRRPGLNREVRVVIMDRGPYARGRVIDLSPAAFERIGDLGEGVVDVELHVVSRGDGRYHRSSRWTQADLDLVGG